MRKGFKWKLGKGTSICFWDDRWLPDLSRLADVAIQELPKEFMEIKVADLISSEGEWNVSQFASYLPQDIVSFVLSQRVNLEEEDRPSWRHTVSGEFSIRSAYMSQTEGVVSSERWLWKSLWRLKVPQRCRMFMWLTCKESLLTNKARVSRGLSTSDHCGCCQNMSETILHVLRDCMKATKVWLLLLPSRFY